MSTIPTDQATARLRRRLIYCRGGGGPPCGPACSDHVAVPIVLPRAKARPATVGARLRLMYAKSTPLVRNAAGQHVSSRSKTGDPKCSAAVSAWRTGNATSGTFVQLAACRAMARGKAQAHLQRAAGHEARAQHIEHLIRQGPATKKDRAAKAKELAAGRKVKGPAPAPAPAAAPAPRDRSPAAARDRIAGRIEATGRQASEGDEAARRQQHRNAARDVLAGNLANARAEGRPGYFGKLKAKREKLAGVSVAPSPAPAEKPAAAASPAPAPPPAAAKPAPRKVTLKGLSPTQKAASEAIGSALHTRSHAEAMNREPLTTEQKTTHFQIAERRRQEAQKALKAARREAGGPAIRPTAAKPETVPIPPELTPEQAKAKGYLDRQQRAGRVAVAARDRVKATRKGAWDEGGVLNTIQNPKIERAEAKVRRAETIAASNSGRINRALHPKPTDLPTSGATPEAPTPTQQGPAGPQAQASASTPIERARRLIAAQKGEVQRTKFHPETGESHRDAPEPAKVVGNFAVTKAQGGRGYDVMHRESGRLLAANVTKQGDALRTADIANRRVNVPIEQMTDKTKAARLSQRVIARLSGRSKLGGGERLEPSQSQPPESDVHEGDFAMEPIPAGAKATAAKLPPREDMDARNAGWEQATRAPVGPTSGTATAGAAAPTSSPLPKEGSPALRNELAQQVRDHRNRQRVRGTGRNVKAQGVVARQLADDTRISDVHTEDEKKALQGMAKAKAGTRAKAMEAINRSAAPAPAAPAPAAAPPQTIASRLKAVVAAHRKDRGLTPANRQDEAKRLREDLPKAREYRAGQKALGRGKFSPSAKAEAAKAAPAGEPAKATGDRMARAKELKAQHHAEIMDPTSAKNMRVSEASSVRAAARTQAKRKATIQGKKDQDAAMERYRVESGEQKDRDRAYREQHPESYRPASSAAAPRDVLASILPNARTEGRHPPAKAAPSKPASVSPAPPAASAGPPPGTHAKVKAGLDKIFGGEPVDDRGMMIGQLARRAGIPESEAAAWVHAAAKKGIVEYDHSSPEQAAIDRQYGTVHTDPATGKPIAHFRIMRPKRLGEMAESAAPAPAPAQAPAPPAGFGGRASSNDPHVFANRVRAAAGTVGPEGRFGGDKVFISHAHAAYEAAHGPIPTSIFKSRLMAANQARHLNLSRADLVEAMDPHKVQASEIPFGRDARGYGGGAFHFIRDEVNPPAKTGPVAIPPARIGPGFRHTPGRKLR